MFDTGIIGQQVLIQMQSRLLESGPPYCAAVTRLYLDGPAKELSAFSSRSDTSRRRYAALIQSISSVSDITD
jgi:hypothetical protein